MIASRVKSIFFYEIMISGYFSAVEAVMGNAISWTYGERLGLLLWKQGEPRWKLAEALGVSRSAVNKWMNDVALPRVEFRHSVAEYFGVPEESLAPDSKDVLSPFVQIEFDGIYYLTLDSDEALLALASKDYAKLQALFKREQTPYRNTRLCGAKGRPSLAVIPDIERADEVIENTQSSIEALGAWFASRGLALDGATKTYIPCEGNEMAPTMTAKDLAVIERTDRVTVPGVYYLDLWGAKVFRRVYRVKEGYKVTCDDSRYPTENLSESEVKVLGRLVRVISDRLPA